ncbi:MAG: hypothetical protein AAFR03_11420 [Pseudomonadota bacterium]
MDPIAVLLSVLLFLLGVRLALHLPIGRAAGLTPARLVVLVFVEDGLKLLATGAGVFVAAPQLFGVIPDYSLSLVGIAVAVLAGSTLGQGLSWAALKLPISGGLRETQQILRDERFRRLGYVRMEPTATSATAI